ncbi:acetoin utilization protein AcuC [Paenibacillus sp. strain BS8-2]
MKSNALFIHHSDSYQYKFGEEHPFDPIRQSLTIDLLKECGALTEAELVAPSIKCSDELLALVHRSDYIEAVKSLNDEADPRSRAVTAEQFGLMTEDTPFFQGMHAAASSIVSGSVSAAEAVMSGQTDHAFHLAGGLHHAFPDKASGFCVYNDAAIAIQYIRERYHARVLYIDTDVHHGDGVQWIFYTDPHVCTYSIHETGKYLFPGTGFASEKGLDSGFGACFNMPLEPFTEDESWLESFNTTLRKVIESFKPDIIVSQHGCDAHAYDPLSHIHCSMNIYREIPAIIHELAHTYTGGKWVAIGGGGYDVWRVVPRAWSMVWLEMSEHPLSSQIKSESCQCELPAAWLERWSSVSPMPLPHTWLDQEEDIPPVPRREQITSNNRLTRDIVIQDL